MLPSVRNGIIGSMQDDGGFDDEEQALGVIRSAESRLGEARFGGGWIDRVNPNLTYIGIAAVDPAQSDIEAILALPHAPRWAISIAVVRFSRAELIGFYEHADPPQNGACSSIGWDPRLNRVVVRLDRLDEETVSYFRARIPSEALQILVEPGGWATAYTDLLPE